MNELGTYFCLNTLCTDYGIRSHGNIALRGKYGKDHTRDLLYCRTCGTRFAASHASALFGMHLPSETVRAIIHHAAEGVGVRATARLLSLDKDTVNRVILRVGEHCAIVLSSLLASHLFLRTRWRRIVLVAFVIPLGILRNGFRILVIGLLCVHVGPHMIDSPIHHRGGPIFFALSLVPLFLLIWWLRRQEQRLHLPV